MAAFEKRAVYQPDDGEGYDFRPGINGLFSVQVGDHPGYGIKLSTSIKADEKAALMREMAAFPVVQAVFEDIVPDAIRPESIGEPANPGVPASDVPKPGA